MSFPTFRHEAMTTYFEIVFGSESPDEAKKTARAAFRAIDQLEAELSRFLESSDISRANRLGPGASTRISETTLDCLLIAADASIATHRAFDPAYASTRPAELGADDPPFTLDPANGMITSRTPQLRLDLGAIGKGYALDRAAETLREWGVTSACLITGGSTVLGMDPPPGAPGWKVGLGEGQGYRLASLLNCALSASGTGVKGVHLVDPRSSRPAARQTRVWSLASSAAQADALSTAFFVMDESEIAAFCAEHPTIGAALAGNGDDLKVLGSLHQILAEPL